MTVYETITERRTIRRFDQNRPVPYELLEKCVNAGRLAPSARNLQPLEYVIVDDPAVAGEVFNASNWGGFAPGGKVEEGRRARAFIIILYRKDLESGYTHQDVGLAAENIILTAQEAGVGSCCLGSIDREKVRQVLSIPDSHEIPLAIALGYPAEAPMAEDTNKPETGYYKDQAGVLHVPKRKLESVLHRNKF
jgi:nitroreductase